MRPSAPTGDPPDGIAGPLNMRANRTRTLVSQMAKIGVAPNQVAYVKGLTLEGDEALLVGVMGGSVSSVQLAESICSRRLMTLQAVH